MSSGILGSQHRASHCPAATTARDPHDGGFLEFGRLVPAGRNALQFRRPNGDSYITAGGEQDLQAIRRCREDGPRGSTHRAS
jgi:hypothetical protein